jgi:hypothetical protein
MNNSFCDGQLSQFWNITDIQHVRKDTSVFYRGYSFLIIVRAGRKNTLEWRWTQEGFVSKFPCVHLPLCLADTHFRIPFNCCFNNKQQLYAKLPTCRVHNMCHFYTQPYKKSGDAEVQWPWRPSNRVSHLDPTSRILSLSETWTCYCIEVTLLLDEKFQLPLAEGRSSPTYHVMFPVNVDSPKERSFNDFHVNWLRNTVTCRGTHYFGTDVSLLSVFSFQSVEWSRNILHLNNTLRSIIFDVQSGEKHESKLFCNPHKSSFA